MKITLSLGEQKVKLILNLVILNLIQIILTIVIIILLTSCAPNHRAPLWLTAIETLPQVKGFSRAGLFTINDKIYVQFCNSYGTQLWMRYNEDKHTWRQSRYNSQGCVDSDNATGPIE